MTASLVLAALSPFAAAQEDSATEDERRLETVIVSDSSQVELTREFAGGQVARGGRAGMLGNLDFLDAPHRLFQSEADPQSGHGACGQQCSR